MKKNYISTIKNNGRAFFIALSMLLSIHSVNAQYCTPSYNNGCNDGDVISNFQLETLNNPSSCSSGYYGDYTALPAPSLIQGLSYPVSVSTTYGDAGVSIWIDFNDDFIFSVSERVGTTSSFISANSTGIINITIPSLATVGSHRLRARLIYNDIATNVDPCNSYGYGEAEDYTVMIIGSTPCSGTPNSGIANSTNALVCANTSFNLSLSGGSSATGLEYQWQSSINGGASWTNVGTSQTTSNLLINSISQNTYYQCITTCTNSTQTATSSIVSINYNPVINCYCMPNSQTLSTDCSLSRIKDFSFANLAMEGVVCAPVMGFSDSTASNYKTINLNAGDTYTISATTLLSGSSTDGIVGAWVDLDQSATFDANEFVSLGVGPSGTYSNTYTVPMTTTAGTVRMRMILDANFPNSSTYIDPCSSYIDNPGQIIDYKVSITEAPVCAGTPNSGDAISSSTLACAADTYTLDLINNDVVSNVSYQWQSSSNATSWVNLGSAQNTIPYFVTSQTATTYYRCVTTCLTSSQTNTSNPVTVQQNLPEACYCTPESLNCSYVSIANVTFETINDAPTCNGNGYTDNSGIVPTVSLTANQTYSISIDVLTESNDVVVGCWIDLNKNGIFDNTEYNYIGTGYAGIMTGTIALPFTTAGGNNRLRIKTESINSQSSTLLDPCLADNYDGQVLDYQLYITPSSSCSASPVAGDAITSAANVCTSTTFTLDLTNNSIASDISYQWQSSPTGTAWTNLGTAQMHVPYVITAQSSSTFYRCITTCNSSALSATSTAVSVSQNPITACYCIPPPSDCGMGDEINSVVFSTLTNTSTCGVDGYSDYTGTVPSVTVTTGVANTIAVTIGYEYYEYVSVWIDYDQNGSFEASEYTHIGSPAGSGNLVASGSIIVPPTALTGTTRMRVRNYSGIALSAGDACNNFEGSMPKTPNAKFLNGQPAYGETEDYLITIVQPDCSDLTFANTYTVTGSSEPLCNAQTASLSITPSLPVATGITYQWYKATSTGTASIAGANGTTLTVGPNENTYYYSEIICHGSVVETADSFQVVVNSIFVNPVVSNTSCYLMCNGSATLNATTNGGTINYSSLPFNVITSDASTGLCAMTYTVEMTNSFGCTISEVLSITEPTELSSSLTGTYSCLGGSIGEISSTVTGGTPPYSYSWSNGAVTPTLSGLAAGLYSLTVVDNNACTNTASINLTPTIDNYSVTISGVSSICEQLRDSVTSTITGGVGPFSYSWIELPTNAVSSSPNYTYSGSIGSYTYNLTVTDNNNGCIVNSNTVAIQVNPSSNISGTVTTNTVTPVAGRVVLYKYLPFYTRFDSVAGQNIAANGSYSFISFTSGTYIVKAIPSASNLQIAYGDTAVNWKKATHILHGCAVNDIQNIEVKPLAVLTGTGTGALSGKIIEGNGFDPQRPNNEFKPTAPGAPIGGIIVKGGKNPGGQMFVQTVTDTAGKYSLIGLPENLPGESYFILVDIPGLDTNQTYHRIIDVSNSNYTNLDFIVDSARINPVNDAHVGLNNITAIENQIKVFPNPASAYVTIQYNLKHSSLVKIELFDMLGRSIKMMLPETQQDTNLQKQSWSTNDLKSGLYFIKMTINGSESIIKLSVTN